MKKLLVTLIALGFSSVAMAGVGTNGAPHNFYDNQCGNNAANFWSFAECTAERTWNDTGEICKVCHIPHRDATADSNNEWAEGKLWNHITTNATFTPYVDTGLYGTVYMTANQPKGSSKLCLSCHDGATAVDAFDTDIAGNSTAVIDTIGSNMYAAGANVDFGIDLRQHHPVSVSYEVGTAAAQLKATNTTMGTGTIADWLENDGTNDLVQCGTCHDPHGDRQTASPNSLLRVRNTATGGSASDASALCLVCHDK